MEVTPIPKTKRIRLHGKALAALNKEIHERDKQICIIKDCGCYVVIGEKFHHEPCGNDKSDEINKGALLCQKHHSERHNSKTKSAAIKKEVEEYLRSVYG